MKDFEQEYDARRREFRENEKAYREGRLSAVEFAAIVTDYRKYLQLVLHCCDNKKVKE